jgi:protein tyrosine phosphatase (PTP) superfamily phosphohydrolase (DUF442 family)
MNQRLLFLATCSLLSACTGYRESMPGVWRSPFPREEQLIHRIEHDNIQTVLCLRGGRTSRQTERAAVNSGAEFVCVPFSAKRLPQPEVLLQLWEVAKTAERPIMVHCRAGVDRTGLTLALIALHDTQDLAVARSQLAFIPNGHIAAFGTEKMDEVLDLYEPYLESLPFPLWVKNVYAEDYKRLTE